MKKTDSAGGVVLNPEGKVLVVNQRGNSWSLPKGHIDPGEDALGAAKREIHEETGVSQLELIRHLETYQRPRIGKKGGDDPSEWKTLHFYLFRTEQTRLAPIDPVHPEARWVPRDQVADMLTHPKDADFFRRILDQLPA